MCVHAHTHIHRLSVCKNTSSSTYGPGDLPKIQSIVIAHVYQLELDGESLLLNTPYILVTEHKEIKLVLASFL